MEVKINYPVDVSAIKIVSHQVGKILIFFPHGVFIGFSTTWCTLCFFTRFSRLPLSNFELSPTQQTTKLTKATYYSNITKSYASVLTPRRNICVDQKISTFSRSLFFAAQSWCSLQFSLQWKTTPRTSMFLLSPLLPISCTLVNNDMQTYTHTHTHTHTYMHTHTHAHTDAKMHAGMHWCLQCQLLCMLTTHTSTHMNRFCWRPLRILVLSTLTDKSRNDRTLLKWSLFLS